MLEAEAKKKGIDIDALKREQLKLSKSVEKKDYMDFSVLQTVGGIAEQINEKTKEIIVGIVVLDNEMNEIEAKWYKERLKFPYIPGFRAYRELHALVSCYEKLENRPDVIFIKAHGIDHPRRLGLASHFGIATNSCVIAISNEPIKSDEAEIKIENDLVFLNGKLVAKLVKLADFAKPITVSIGNKVSLEKAVEITKKFGLGKYKFPYPLISASKYLREIVKES